jgi:choline dehydrogenase-like flavoprotein
MLQDYFDVVIIGGGASGLAAAWRLSESKLNVVILEQGKKYKEKEYHKKNIDWEIQKLDKFNLNPNIRNNESDYPIDCSNSDIEISNFNGLGGSTVLYSGHFPRFHPSDFKVKSLDGIANDWPINYSDLVKYYEINDKITGVHGLGGDPAYQKIKNLKKPINPGIIGNKIAIASKKLNWHCWPSYSAINIDNNFSVKTVNQTYLPLLKNKKNIKIKENSRVVKILSDEKKVRGVLYINKKGEKRKIKSKIVILACNGIGTPRLLLASKNKYHKNGLANSSGLVGKNLMLHPLAYVEGIFNDYLHSDFGPEGCCVYSHQFYETNKKNDHKRGFTLQVLRGSSPLDSAIYLNKINKLKFGNTFFNDFFKYYNRVIPIAVITEDLPVKNNSISLDYNNKDSSGLPGVKVNYKLEKNNKKILKNGIQKAKKLLNVAGANEINAYAPVRYTGWHLMGTAKMGNNKNTSVVNKFGQSHDLKNLIIIDSSIFVTSSAVNPVSTIQALSLMIADNIIRNFNAYN